MNLKSAFTELQAKVIDTQQKVKLADIQIEQLNRTKKHAHLTDTEIMTLVDETNMYEGITGVWYYLQICEVVNSSAQNESQVEPLTNAIISYKLCFLREMCSCRVLDEP
ncbi:Pfdn1 [Phodopus roborovskii]|uniref:Prefoldin subunit 1 n=1 Tax=Phodopus roborovskii TaxID=109678 RepID=A0AAV0A0G8_PHORO|nr:Pfdn1 [Phodopus roborovskii]